MKKLEEWLAVAVMLLSMTMFNGCSTYRQGTYDSQTSYENPQWGPSYSDGTRYYYLLDIESYYDIYTREFIFLNHAQWIYSPYLPSIYQNFDLNNSFVVVVNSNDNSRNNPVNNTNQAENPVNSPVNRQTQNDNNKVTSPKGTDNTARPQPANTTETRRTTNTNYYGVPIGQPVKVDRQMRIQNTTGTAGRSNNNTESQRNSSGSKNTQSSQGRR